MSAQLIIIVSIQKYVRSIITVINQPVIKIINKGLEIEPCGIPLRTSLQKDKKPLILTICIILPRNDVSVVK